ncbi:MAG: DASH family cryptochrome, partial [Bacteroidota bacterium]
REVLPTPDHIPTPAIQAPEIQVSTPLSESIDQRSVLPFQGGESAAKERLHQYFWKQDLLRTYKETRNGLIGADYSSKFSAWLSLGCISPRFIYQQVKAYEKERKKNSSTYWLIFELIWRDFFRFIAKKHGNQLFLPGGLKGSSRSYQNREADFEAWREGNTGFPFIDANMRELKTTGFMSNRGRQNVASFLVHDLKIDWRWGAAYFESQLLDYDVCSNWGNWNYVAGVGNDPRENRYFNTLSQAKRYDAQGEYLKLWVPELAELPPQLLFDPGSANRSELSRHGVHLGTTYPYPIVRLGGKPTPVR